MDVNETCERTEKKDEDEKENTPADFEKAMEASGFGLFNLLLLVMSIPATCASVFESTTMSYILPIAECDLQLTLFHKGVLNAVTYGGMIISAIFWGYLADTQGRRKILVYGFLADSICFLCVSLSQNFQMLVVFKFFGGFIVNGPGAVLFTYLTELHGAKHRPRVLMILGMVTTTATLLLPVLALSIFPRYWDFVFFEKLKIHSWNIFLLICGIPSLISGLIIISLPESPKFLMSQGRNAEALRSFQTIYAYNTRKPKHTYPIRSLVEEVPSRQANINEVIFTIENKPLPKPKLQNRTITEAWHDGLQQLKPMFRKPLLGHSIHVYTMQFCILLGLNTIRLWLPQLFASTAEYEALKTSAEGSSNMCTILEYSVNKTSSNVVNFASDCAVHKEISLDMYFNNIIVALTGLVGYCFAGFIVKGLGAKNLLTFGLIISAGLGMGLYWSSSSLSTLIISSAFVSISSISTSSLLGVVVNLFPTSLRTMIVAIAMMFGRLGALSGNMLFPVFVELGCIPPFLMVGLVMLCAGALSCILPNPKKSTFT